MALRRNSSLILLIIIASCSNSVISDVEVLLRDGHLRQFQDVNHKGQQASTPPTFHGNWTGSWNLSSDGNGKITLNATGEGIKTPETSARVRCGRGNRTEKKSSETMNIFDISGFFQIPNVTEGARGTAGNTSHYDLKSNGKGNDLVSVMRNLSELKPNVASSRSKKQLVREADNSVLNFMSIILIPHKWILNQTDQTFGLMNTSSYNPSSSVNPICNKVKDKSVGKPNVFTLNTTVHKLSTVKQSKNEATHIPLIQILIKGNGINNYQYPNTNISATNKHSVDAHTITDFPLSDNISLTNDTTTINTSLASIKSKDCNLTKHPSVIFHFPKGTAQYRYIITAKKIHNLPKFEIIQNVETSNSTMLTHHGDITVNINSKNTILNKITENKVHDKRKLTNLYTNKNDCATVPHDVHNHTFTHDNNSNVSWVNHPTADNDAPLKIKPFKSVEYYFNRENFQDILHTKQGNITLTKSKNEKYEINPNFTLNILKHLNFAKSIMSSDKATTVAPGPNRGNNSNDSLALSDDEIKVNGHRVERDIGLTSNLQKVELYNQKKINQAFPKHQALSNDAISQALNLDMLTCKGNCHMEGSVENRCIDGKCKKEKKLKREQPSNFDQTHSFHNKHLEFQTRAEVTVNGSGQDNKMTPQIKENQTTAILGSELLPKNIKESHNIQNFKTTYISGEEKKSMLEKILDSLKFGKLMPKWRDELINTTRKVMSQVKDKMSTLIPSIV